MADQSPPGPDALPGWARRALLRGLDSAGRLAPGWVHSLVAVAALVECDGCLLVLDRSDGEGLGLPGGLVHWRESAPAALRREVQEETGYLVQPGALFGVYSDPDRDRRMSAVVVVYAACLIGGRPRPTGEGRASWLNLAAPIPPMAFADDRIVHEYLSRIGCPGRRPIDA